MRSSCKDPELSNRLFGQGYADFYDILYQDKDYKGECDLLEEVFQRYSDVSAKTILDVGCGTGSHALILARRGYHVVGVDRSSEMIDLARSKAGALQAEVGGQVPLFQQQDLRKLDLKKKFDVVLMMFAVLGYQLSNADVSAALSAMRRHLRPGGLLIGDVWYGPAVLTIRPGERLKVIPTEQGKIIRAASGLLNTFEHTATVRYQTWAIEENHIVKAAEENHQIRYFFPRELALFMEKAELELLGLHAFGYLDKKPDENTWNVMLVCRPTNSPHC